VPDAAETPPEPDATGPVEQLWVRHRPSQSEWRQLAIAAAAGFIANVGTVLFTGVALLSYKQQKDITFGFLWPGALILLLIGVTYAVSKSESPERRRLGRSARLRDLVDEERQPLILTKIVELGLYASAGLVVLFYLAVFVGSAAAMAS
jgi:hypothetical protein